MKTEKISTSQIITFACAIPLLVCLVLQFIPYWDIADHALTVADYIWNPKHYLDVTKYFTEQFEGYDINQMVGGPFIMLVSSVVGIIFAFFKSKTPLSHIAAMISGIAGISFYALQPACRLSSHWVVYTVISAVILAYGIFAMVMLFRDFVKRLGFNKYTIRKMFKGY